MVEPPGVLTGGAAAPGAESIELLHKKFEAKVNAGAQFFQTQPVFSAPVVRSFMDEVRPYARKVLAGVLVLRSVKMAEYVNAHVAGIDIPEETLRELRDAGEAHATEAGIEIAVRTIRAVRPFCDGVHVMAGRLTHRLPEIIRKAGLN